MIRLKIRKYEVRWHWRDQHSGLIKSDPVAAASVERACRKLRRLLAEEYSFERSELVIVEVRLSE